MRKPKFLTIILLIATALPVCAQFEVGIKAGMTANVVNANMGYMVERTYNSQFGRNLGFEVAVPMQYQFLDFLALRWEVSLQQRQNLFQNAKYYYDIQRNLYLDVPVMVSFLFGGDKVRGFVNIGGYIGGWIAGWDKMLYNPNEVNDGWGKESKHQFIPSDTRLDGGLLAGIGVRWMEDRPVSMSLEYRYNLGLSSRLGHVPTGNYYIKDMPMSLCLGVHFKTNK